MDWKSSVLCTYILLISDFKLYNNCFPWPVVPSQCPSSCKQTEIIIGNSTLVTQRINSNFLFLARCALCKSGATSSINGVLQEKYRPPLQLTTPLLSCSWKWLSVLLRLASEKTFGRWNDAHSLRSSLTCGMCLWEARVDRAANNVLAEGQSCVVFNLLKSALPLLAFAQSEMHVCWKLGA